VFLESLRLSSLRGPLHWSGKVCLSLDFFSSIRTPGRFASQDAGPLSGPGAETARVALGCLGLLAKAGPRIAASRRLMLRGLTAGYGHPGRLPHEVVDRCLLRSSPRNTGIPPRFRSPDGSHIVSRPGRCKTPTGPTQGCPHSSCGEPATCTSPSSGRSASAT
jgi:hypothetical protein